MASYWHSHTTKTQVMAQGNVRGETPTNNRGGNVHVIGYYPMQMHAEVAQPQKDDHVMLDVRFWLACTMLGVLLTFMVVSFPGY